MQNHNFNSSWEKVDFEKSYERNIKWEKMKQNEFPIINKRAKDNSNLFLIENYQIRVLNRSIVFQGNDTVGPDINWLIPPGFAWNQTYQFDASIRGHNRRKGDESFWG